MPNRYEFSKVDISPERKIILNMLTQTDFLREFVEYPLHFQTPYAKIISKWCIEFYQDYQTAPKKDIDQLFLNKRSIMQDDDIEVIGRFLRSLSDQLDTEQKTFNLPYEIKTAEEYLQEQSLKDFKETLDQHMERGDLRAADALIARYSLPERGAAIGSDLLWDEDVIREAFAMGDPYVMKYPGVLGQVIPGMYPGEVTGFMARTGLGKTWWMIYTMLRAAELGIPVLLISLEMSVTDMMKRIWQARLNMRAIHDTNPNVSVAEFVKMEGMDYIQHNDIEAVNLKLEDVLTNQKGLRYLWQGTQAKVWAYPTNTLRMGGLKNDLMRASQREGFQPQLVLIDYPAIMDNSGKDERRIRVEQTWVELKQLASELNIAIMGALQVTSDKLKPGQRPDLTSIPDAKVISSHMAQLFALWTTKNDEGKGVMRVSPLKSRHSGRSMGDAVITYNHSIGQAYIDSRLSSKVAF